MSTFSFEDIQYYPFIRTRLAELTGLRFLADEVKDQIMPVVTLGKWRDAKGTDKAYGKIVEAVGNRKFIMDVTDVSDSRNPGISALLDSEKHFANWQKFVSADDNIVPVIQITSAARQRDVIRQAMDFEKSGRAMAFRVSDFLKDTARIIPALAALEAPEDAVVIIDAGFIRNGGTDQIRSGRMSALIDIINQVRNEVPESVIVIASTSFPRSVAPSTPDGTFGEIRMLEDEFAGEFYPEFALYGDHASIHSVVYDSQGGPWDPRIDIPRASSWFFERRAGKKGAEGYPDAARAILDRFPELKDSDQWGAKMIVATANQDDKSIKAPVTSVAVRVNLHIYERLGFLRGIMDGVDEDEDLDDLAF